MTVKVQVLLNQYERDLFRQQAKADGLSLSAWLKQAGHDQLSVFQAKRPSNSVKDLDAFFASCDEREQGRKPDWEQHREVINRSMDKGLSGT